MQHARGVLVSLALLAVCIAEGARNATVLCNCPGLVWTVQPQGNLSVHTANVEALNRANAGQGVELAFYGDSITQAMSLMGGTGFLAHYGKYKAINLGLAADKIYNLLWRMMHGELPSASLKVAVFLIGTNDIGFTEWCTEDAADTLLAVPSISSRLQHLFTWFSQGYPTTQVVLSAILPRGGYTAADLSAWPNRLTPTINAVNAKLKAIAATNAKYHFIDCGHLFLVNGTGPLNVSDYIDANLHFLPSGYEKYYKCMQPLIDTLMITSGASMNIFKAQTNADSLPKSFLQVPLQSVLSGENASTTAFANQTSLTILPVGGSSLAYTVHHDNIQPSAYAATTTLPVQVDTVGTLYNSSDPNNICLNVTASNTAVNTVIPVAVSPQVLGQPTKRRSTM